MLTTDELVAQLAEEVLRLSLMVGHIRVQLGLQTAEDMRKDIDAVGQNLGIETEWSS